MEQLRKIGYTIVTPGGGNENALWGKVKPPTDVGGSDGSQYNLWPGSYWLPFPLEKEGFVCPHPKVAISLTL